MKIVTHYDPKPIPMRCGDWTAIDDDTYDGPGAPIGNGETEARAVADLMEQVASFRCPRLVCKKWCGAEYCKHPRALTQEPQP